MSTADVMAARGGDPDAFTRLVQAQATTVCSIAAAITGDVRASEEVAQDVFVAAWQGLKKLQNPASFGPWLRQLTRNRAHDHVRRQIRRREAGEEPLARIAGAPDAEEQALAAERERALWEALDELPTDHREVLILFYREGQSVAQVAALLELTEPAVRQRLSRARSALRADVIARLGDAMQRTAPSGAFVAAVSAALATGAPSTAHAAATVVAGKGLGALLGGAAIGATFGLAGVVLGYRAAARHADDAGRAALLRSAVAQGLAVLAATASFLLLPPVVGIVLGMTLLVAVIWAAQLLTFGGRPRMGLVGLIGGTLAGLGGAIVGIASSGAAPADAIAGQLFQAIAFLAVPVVLFAVIPAALGIPRRWLVAGAATWLLALPLLFASSGLAFAAFGTPLAAVVGLSLGAGLFEETGRYLLFRRFGGDAARAVVVGVGHGGVEALLFGAQVVAGALLVPGAPPWTYVSFGLARLALLVVHVGLSVLVWRAISERRPSLWALAVVLHVGLDLAAFGAPMVWSHGLWIGGLAVFGGALAAAALIRGALSAR